MMTRQTELLGPERPKPAQRPLRAVVLDMDGTITRPLMDFDAIATAMGISRERAILETLADMPPAERAAAEAVLVTHERAAAQASELSEGAVELFDGLASRGLPVGLLTRNCRACVDIVLSRHRLTVDAVVAREDAPAKPAPDGLWKLAAGFGVPAETVLMIGDYVFDIRAGLAAGAWTALLTHGRAWPFAGEAHFEIVSLREAVGLIDELRRATR